MKHTLAIIVALCLIWVIVVPVIAGDVDNTPSNIVGDLWNWIFPTTTPTPAVTPEPTVTVTPTETAAIEPTAAEPISDTQSTAISQQNGNIGKWVAGAIADVSPATTGNMIQSDDKGTVDAVNGADVSVRPITSGGDVQGAVDPSNLNTATSVGLEIDNSTSTVRKIVQVLPQSRVLVSPDGLEVMQVSATPPVLQIYYGYQTDKYHPFAYFYKVDNLDSSPCIAYRTIFATKSIDMEEADCSKVREVMDMTSIPKWEALP